MNKYIVQVNSNHPRETQASKTATAVNNVCRLYKESEFKPFATIFVRFIGKAIKVWDIDADVLEKGSYVYTRQTVHIGSATKEDALNEARRLTVANPDWKFIRVQSRNV